MKQINGFNCPICLRGEVKVFKVSEFKEDNKFCMRAIYKATCNCVLKGDKDEKGEGEEAAKDVSLAVGRQGRNAEESLAKI